MNDFVQEYWLTKSKELLKAVENDPNGYLSSRPFLETMVVGGAISSYEQDHVANTFDRSYLLQIESSEPKLGEPAGKFALRGFEYSLSYNTVRHLWELSLLTKSPGFVDVRNYVEWGGGFGNMTRLIRKLSGFNEYIIVDLPELSLIQEKTLRHFGYDDVFLNKQIGSQGSGIYLVDIDHLDLMIDYKTDCFISCWALSESSGHAIEYVVNSQAFGAYSSLVIRQNSSNLFNKANTVEKLFDTWYDKFELPHLPGNTALVR